MKDNLIQKTKAHKNRSLNSLYRNEMMILTVFNITHIFI